MATISKISASPVRIAPRKRVAAYARVSMETELLLHSLSAQVSHYSKLIQANPEWEYAGVYADEGVTGTSTAHRDEFNRLMADCDAGKIDIVLAKSISRFARDTVDCLNAVRHLKNIGVEVRFEREGGWAWICPDEGKPRLRIVAEAQNEETARELCDFCEGRLKSLCGAET